MRDEAEGTLAEQAAAWVPPWARPPVPAAAAQSGRADPPSAEPPPGATDPAGAATPGEASPGDPGPAAAPAVAEEVGPVSAPSAVAGAGAGPTDPDPPSAAAGDLAAGPAGSPGPADTDPAQPDPDPLALVGDGELRGALEAILLVVDEPVGEVALAQALEQPAERITALLGALAEEYSAHGRGFELRRAAGGWRLYTRPRYAGYVERFVLDGQQARLTQAALETLAVIAYKQPVTRARISAIRGVNCDGVIRTLVSRGLVAECGTEPDSGAYLYRTTSLFLEKLGLDSVAELPPLAPFLPDDVPADVDEVADAQR